MIASSTCRSPGLLLIASVLLVLTPIFQVIYKSCEDVGQHFFFHYSLNYLGISQNFHSSCEFQPQCIARKIQLFNCFCWLHRLHPVVDYIPPFLQLLLQPTFWSKSWSNAAKSQGPSLWKTRRSGTARRRLGKLDGRSTSHPHTV